MVTNAQVLEGKYRLIKLQFKKKKRKGGGKNLYHFNSKTYYHASC